ncbi:uncharacterized protein IWZ02DRAFT_440229 [Phyllosticta citriasiana]|uniref:uncharacterized protein n=1 Tax=Phyllosticta citriasiana TaxID=595635 RepID=UPI0030FD549D
MAGWLGWWFGFELLDVDRLLACLLACLLTRGPGGVVVCLFPLLSLMRRGCFNGLIPCFALLCLAWPFLTLAS